MAMIPHISIGNQYVIPIIDLFILLLLSLIFILWMCRSRPFVVSLLDAAADLSGKPKLSEYRTFFFSRDLFWNEMLIYSFGQANWFHFC